MTFSKTLLVKWSAGLAAIAIAAVPASRVARTDNVVGTAAPAAALDPANEGAFRHLRALQEIATANGGNRAAGTPGYDRSAEYVAEKLKAAGYAVRFEEFEFSFFEERTRPVLVTTASDGAQESTPERAVRTLDNSGSGDVTARLRPVKLQLGEGAPPPSVSGCEAADFQGFERGAVALVRRGTCQFQVKVDNAVTAGAAGVVIMNEGIEGRNDAFSGVLGKPATVPVVGIPFDLGRSLSARAEGGATVRLAVDAVIGKRATRNVLADADVGREEPIVVVGAHLDSVSEGPGINDNGSGSAAVLEAALRLAQAPLEARGRVRFAFWSAEERGLLGSRHHVASLTEEQRRQIAIYINLDMVGSPNFARSIRVSSAEAQGLAATVRRELLAEFREHNWAIDERTGGRTGSDDAAFYQKDIPTVGLSAGAFGAKSEAQVGLFGGTAGKPFDPCYHRACDTVDNIDRDVLEQNTRALMRALRTVTLATRSSGAPVQKAVDTPERRR